MHRNFGDVERAAEAADAHRPELERLDQRREAVRVIREAEIRGHVRGAARPRLVSGDDPELVGQRGELRPPDATVLGGTAYEHERQPLANALVGDLEPIRSDDLHRRTLQARSEQSGRRAAAKPDARPGRDAGARECPKAHVLWRDGAATFRAAVLPRHCRRFVAESVVPPLLPAVELAQAKRSAKSGPRRLLLQRGIETFLEEPLPVGLLGVDRQMNETVQ